MRYLTAMNRVKYEYSARTSTDVQLTQFTVTIVRSEIVYTYFTATATTVRQYYLLWKRFASADNDLFVDGKGFFPRETTS